MQTATSRAFAQGAPKLEALLARTKLACQEAPARAKVTAPRYQIKSSGKIWKVIDIANSVVIDATYRYEVALALANQKEVASKNMLPSKMQANIHLE
jgi:hypothetical protein